MSKQKHVVTGEVAFSNLVERDTYKGKPTKYGLVLQLDEPNAELLRSLNVQVGTYQPKDEEGNTIGDVVAQRKFSSNYQTPPVDADGQPVWATEDSKQELPRGSVVRIWFTTSPNEEYGEIPYLGGVRVLELGEGTEPEEF